MRSLPREQQNHKMDESHQTVLTLNYTYLEEANPTMSGHVYTPSLSYALL